MKRHVVDHPPSRDPAIRNREFYRVAREESRHPASRTLHQRPHDERGDAKLRAFLKIDKGRTV